MPLDRASHRRTDDAWLAQAWASEDARVLRAAPQKIRLERTTPPDGLTFEEVLFLGLDDDGRPLFGVDAGDDAEALTPLMQTLATIDPEEAEIAAFLVGLVNWHRTHGFCSNCGAPSRKINAGYGRRCPECATEHYPRTDPVVQVMPHDGERCVLGRSHHWPDTFFSVVAGFVEPGETPERAALRELHEETGLTARELIPGGSQPWPMPHQLLIGFSGRCTSLDGARAGDDLAEIRTFGKDELRAVMEHKELLIPPRRALAGALIRAWLEDA